MTVIIEREKQLKIDEFKPLVEESQQNGFRFVKRLADGWENGSNQFNRAGEFILVAKINEQIVGTCGLNIDPYQAVMGLGRVRHLYVLSDYRRQGIASRLIDRVVEDAKPYFHTLNLRTDSDLADKFYLNRGFQSSHELPECTHWLRL